MINNFGDGIHDEQQACLNLLLLLTLKGTPFLYNGEEIGMNDFICSDPQTFRDSSAMFAYRMGKEVFKMDEAAAAQKGAEYGRDKCRTPMHWSAGENGGFSPVGVSTWLPVNPNYQNGINVEDQLKNDDSLWRYYQRLLSFRRNSPALLIGDFTVTDPGPVALLGFRRTIADQELTVLLNFSDSPLEIKVEPNKKILLQTGKDAVNIKGENIHFQPYGGAILQRVN
jgi:alpha-glucosidase